MPISPAPWRTEGYRNLIVNDAQGNTIAMYPGCGSAETGVANARLIAAAPELLESLQRTQIYLVKLISWSLIEPIAGVPTTELQEQLSHVVEAIASATGNTNAIAKHLTTRSH